MAMTKKKLINIAYGIDKSNWVFETSNQSFFKLMDVEFGLSTIDVYSGEILNNKFITTTDLGFMSVNRRSIFYVEEPERERNIRFDISCEGVYFEDRFFSSSVRKLYEHLLNKN